MKKTRMTFEKSSLKILLAIIIVVIYLPEKTWSLPGDCDASSINICNPSSSCKTAEKSCSKVYDPLDCHNYYLCINSSSGVVPSNNPVSCPSGRQFNFEAQDCEIEVQPCDQPCVHHDCKYFCSEALGVVIADPQNCSIFYYCQNGQIPLPFDCDEKTPYFNGLACTNDVYSCCSACIPYCDSPDIETMDPYDCNSYYLCKEKGVPGERYHYRCPTGESFNANARRCNTTTEECTSLCQRSTTTSVTACTTTATTITQVANTPTSSKETTMDNSKTDSSTKITPKIVTTTESTTSTAPPTTTQYVTTSTTEATTAPAPPSTTQRETTSTAEKKTSPAPPSTTQRETTTTTKPTTTDSGPGPVFATVDDLYM